MEEIVKVFLCHSSNDKARFVRGFAKRLASRGVEVWIDENQMLLGDDVDHKIFFEGFSGITAFIAVLSKESVKSEWVQREITNAVERSKNEGFRLIPVLIDPDCEIPKALEGLIRTTVTDVTSYDDSFEGIVRSIYERRPQLELGERPKYTTFKDRVAGLDPIDAELLRFMFYTSLDKQSPFVDINVISAWAESQDLPREELNDSLEVLHEKSFIKLERVLGPSRFVGVMLAGYSLTRCLKIFLENYEEEKRKVMLHLANGESHLSHSLNISESLSLDHYVVEGILRDLENEGRISATRTNVDTIVTKVSPQLKRDLRFDSMSI